MKHGVLLFFAFILFQGFTICTAQSIFSDTSLYKSDTVINTVNINNSYFSIEFLRNNTADRKSLYNDSAELIFVIKNIHSNKIVYYKEFKENTYTIFKVTSDTLSKKGKLFIEMDFDGGGSGFSGTCYEVVDMDGHFILQKVYTLDELSLFYLKSEDDIIKMEGIWNFAEDESHFSEHRYLITRYNYINHKFVQTKLGKTRFKYASLFGNRSPKQILRTIKRKEPQILKNINL